MDWDLDLKMQSEGDTKSKGDEGPLGMANSLPECAITHKSQIIREVRKCRSCVTPKIPKQRRKLAGQTNLDAVQHQQSSPNNTESLQL